MSKLTSTQLGRACEHLVAAELAFAGHPAVIMPDGWPGYDLVARGDGLIKIQVKGMEYDGGRHNQRQAGWWRYDPDKEWDWLALVYINGATREIYLVPRHATPNISVGGTPSWGTLRRINRAKNPGLDRFRNNFGLKDNADPAV